MLTSVAGFCGVASSIVAFITLLVVFSKSPGFNWKKNYLSILGVKGSAARVFNYGLAVTGLLGLIFDIGLGKTLPAGQWLGQIFTVSLILGAVAFSAIGIFPRTMALSHKLASLLFFIFVSLAIFLFGIQAVFASHTLLGIMNLAVVVSMAFFQVMTRLRYGKAVPQLLSYLPCLFWTAGMGFWLLLGAVS